GEGFETLSKMAFGVGQFFGDFVDAEVAFESVFEQRVYLVDQRVAGGRGGAGRDERLGSLLGKPADFIEQKGSLEHEPVVESGIRVVAKAVGFGDSDSALHHRFVQGDWDV